MEHEYLAHLDIGSLQTSFTYGDVSTKLRELLTVYTKVNFSCGLT